MLDSGLKPFVRRIEEAKLTVYGAEVYRHGVLAARHRWVNDQPINIHSLSKSFVSTAVGMAIDEGLLSLESRPADILPDKLPAHPSDNLLRMTLRDLLIMSAGHDQSHMLGAQRRHIQTKDWVRHYLAQPVVRKPGEVFLYDTGCTYLAAAMLRAVADETVLSYLGPRLFEPLGIDEPLWVACPQGLPLAGGGLYLSLTDAAKLGLLYLQKGMWNGKRLLSENWVREAQRAHIATTDRAPLHDGHYGYGYQFWRGRHGSYRGDGMYGQFVVVLEEQDAVIAVQSREYHNPLDILQVAWETILPDL